MEQDYVKTHNQDGLVLLPVGDHVFHPSASRSGEELGKLNWRNDVEVTCNVTTQNSQFLTETNLATISLENHRFDRKRATKKTSAGTRHREVRVYFTSCD